MEPTLIGDPACGDQILVNKLAYQNGGPKRWDVVVFRHPLNNAYHFLKRVVGLPGEKIAIKNGNLYLGEEIVRKPPRVQEELLFPVFLGGDEFSGRWKFQGSHWKKEKEWVSLETHSLSWCQYAHRIVDEYLPQKDRFFLKREKPVFLVGGNHHVGEISIALEATCMTDEGSVMVQIRGGHKRFLLVLSFEGSSLLCYQGESMQPYYRMEFEFRLRSRTSYRIRMSNLDEIVSVSLDDVPVISYDYALPASRTPQNTYESGVKFGGKNGIFVFSNIRLWRDIYYIGRRDMYGGANRWEIPSGHYFVLGDNSAHSHDSRDWKKFRMTLKNGICIDGDQENLPVYREETYHFEIGRASCRERV